MEVPLNERRDPFRSPKLRYKLLNQHWLATYGHPYPDRRQHEQPHAISPSIDDISTQRGQHD